MRRPAVPVAIGAAIVLASQSGIGLLPLFAGLGYEHALVSGLTLPLIASLSAAFWSLGHPARSPLAIGAGGAAIGLLFSALAATLAMLFGLRVAACGVLGNLSYFALSAGAGTTLGGLYGACVALVATRTRFPRRLGGLLALIGPLGSIGVGLIRFYSSPMIFAYDPFVGYFSGTLYDTAIDASALPSYRLGTLATAIATFSILGLLSRDASGRVRAAPLPTSTRMVLRFAVLFFGGASVTNTALGTRLGHFSTPSSIANDLAGALSGPRCDIIYPAGMDPKDARLLVADCEEQLGQVESRLAIRYPHRVKAYFFQDAREKKRLMGAAHTYIAKPWRREVYLQVSAYPHPVLAHELAHVVLGEVAPGPFRVAGAWRGLLPNPGLIEGAAVALSPREDALSETDWTRAMLEAGKLPPLEPMFSLAFLGQNARKSYTVTGAFVRFILLSYGPTALKRWYAGDSLDSVTGKSFSLLEADFIAELRKRSLGSDAAAYARAKFDAPSVFGRRCPHETDGLREHAERCLAERKVGQAVAAYDAILQMDPNDTSASLTQACIRLRHESSLDAAALLERVAGDEKVALSYRDRAEECLADAAWLRGDFDAAAGRYERLAARCLDEDPGRTYEVKALAVRSLGLREGVRELLLGTADRPPNVAHAVMRLSSPSVPEADRPLAHYLLGRLLATTGRPEAAWPYLEDAYRSPPSDRVLRETLRLEAVLACALGDRSRIDALRTRLAALPTAHEGRLGSARVAGILSLLDRCGGAERR